MTTQKGVARYTDLEGTPFEIFEVPDKPDQSLVVIDPSTHPFGFLLQHRQFEDPELTWSGEIEREVVAGLLRMDENAEVWADAWGWWASTYTIAANARARYRSRRRSAAGAHRTRGNHG